MNGRPQRLPERGRMAVPHMKHPDTGRVYHRSAKPRKGAARTFGEAADWSDYHGSAALYQNRIVDLIRCLRPGQWVMKNALLLAAPFFAWFDRAQPAFSERAPADWVGFFQPMVLAVIAFVLASSAAYVFNDLHDAAEDSKNPQKKDRPIAARRVSPAAAVVLMLLCLIGAGGSALFVGSQAFLWILGAYLLLQPLYTCWLRRYDTVGASVVACGFVLRAVAGAFAVGVRFSPWLLLCVFAVALFVSLCKRRSVHFLDRKHLPSMADGRILDMEIGLTASVTVACYALYTLAPQTLTNFGTDRLVYTVFPVVLGIFRYLRLTYGERKAGIPEQVILRDPLLLALILGWILLCGILLWTATPASA